MSELQTKIPTDTWVPATWNEFVQATEESAYSKAKFYYHNGQLRIEMPPIGPDHAGDNTIIIFIVNLFCTIAGIPVRGFTNCSYRKTGVRESQPDVSYYINNRVSLAPKGSSVVDLDFNAPPDLAIEISDTTLSDDIGEKRLLYEELQVAEYWVVNVKKAQVIAFQVIANNGSQRIAESQVLPGLKIALLEAVLQRSHQTDNSQVGTWFLAQIQERPQP